MRLRAKKAKKKIRGKERTNEKKVPSGPAINLRAFLAGIRLPL